ncbi:MAG: hypothetical protein ACT4PJ_01255 [Gemmatimonadaceae bacterium]
MRRAANRARRAKRTRDVGPATARRAERDVRTDSTGVARVRVTSRGAWDVKFTHMEARPPDTTIDYESKWATLTFGVR